MKLGRQRNYHKGWAALKHYVIVRAFSVIVKTDGSFAALVLTCSCFNIHLIPFHDMGEKCSRVARTSVFPYCSVNVKCSLSCDSVYFNDCKKSLKWRGSVCLGSIFTCNLHRGAAVSAARCLPGERWSWQAVKQQSYDRPRDAFIFWHFKMYDKH